MSYFIFSYISVDYSLYYSVVLCRPCAVAVGVVDGEAVAPANEKQIKSDTHNS